MVARTVKSGLLCECRSSVLEAGEFRLSVDPSVLETKATLTLKTKTETPIKVSPMEIIQGPGEYEVAGVKVRGLDLEKESTPKELRTMYLVEMDGLVLCFLGSIKKDLDESFLEKIDEIDVLFVEEGEAPKIAPLVKDVDPRVVICRGEGDAKFLAKELGQSAEAVEKINLKKKDLSEGETKLVWLK